MQCLWARGRCDLRRELRGVGERHVLRGARRTHPFPPFSWGALGRGDKRAPGEARRYLCGAAGGHSSGGLWRGRRPAPQRGSSAGAGAAPWGTRSAVREEEAGRRRGRPPAGVPQRRLRSPEGRRASGAGRARGAEGGSGGTRDGAAFRTPNSGRSRLVPVCYSVSPWGAVADSRPVVVLALVAPRRVGADPPPSPCWVAARLPAWGRGVRDIVDLGWLPERPGCSALPGYSLSFQPIRLWRSSVA